MPLSSEPPAGPKDGSRDELVNTQPATSGSVAGRVPFSARGASALVCHGVLIMLCVSVIIPFLMLVSGSLTSEVAIDDHGVGLLPLKFSTAAYHYAFSSPDVLLRAYGVTIFVTAVGTIVSLLLTAMLGYVMARRDYVLARVTTFVVFFTLLFNGGLVPFFIVITRYLHLGNTVWAMIVPGLLAPFNVLIMKGYMTRFNYEVVEAGKLDGASELRIFFQLVVPTIKPVLATLAVLISFAYWNEYFNALLFVSNTNLYPLQLMLYNLSSSLAYLQQNPQEAAVLGLHNPAATPYISAELAIVILGVVPFVIIFSFLRRYFREGLTVGSLKG